MHEEEGGEGGVGRFCEEVGVREGPGGLERFGLHLLGSVGEGD